MVDELGAGIGREPSPAREGMIHAVGLAAAIFGMGYLLWRVGWTVSGADLWLAIPMLVAELHGYVTYLGYLLMTWDCREPKRETAFDGATVDFFIPTYNEAFSVLAPVVAGAIDIRYPHMTYVLDDGRRDWVKSLCERLGAQYITRPDNQGAKAGNLNHALAQTTGEFVAVVDADFVPSPNFIHDMLGYFRDKRVAFVQAPQEFYNRESFQHLAGDAEGWHEQTLFFKTIQLGKNRWNAAFWCGCPSILRRAALDSIGGVATETVTEDLHTSLKLHRNGWRSVYHPGTVALGIAPNDYSAFILQRLRWAEGTMQVIRREWRAGGLSLGQRINYMASTGTYFDSIRKAVFLAIVPLVLLTDQLPVHARAAVFLPIWATQFVLFTLANNLLARGHNRYLMTEFFDLTKMFAFIQSTFTLLSGRRVRFKVTPKGASEASDRLRRVFPFAILGLLYLFSIEIGLLRLGVAGWSTAHPAVQVAAVLWGLAILAALTVVMVYGYSKVSKRQADRVSVRFPGTYRMQDGPRQPLVIEDLTTVGCAFRTATPPAVGTKLQVLVDEGATAFAATVQRVRPDGSESIVGLSVDAPEVSGASLAILIAKGLFAKQPLVAVGPALLPEAHEQRTAA